MHRTLLGIFAVFATSLGLIGLTFSSSREQAADFRFVNGSEPRTLDPQLMTGEPAFRIAHGIFEGLTRLDAQSLRPSPGVAESWEISPDGKRYVFRLRPDAVWSDGVPVTAHDFAYAWRRLQEPETGAEYAYVHHGIWLADALNTHGAHVVALSEKALPALSALRKARPRGIDADAWQAFVAEQALVEITKGTREPIIGRLIARRSGEVTSRELARLETALMVERMRRETLHREAVEHYGVDAGVYATDDRTLVVELLAPMPYFLDLTAFPPSFPAPRRAIEAEGGGRSWFLPGRIVSNGPFELAWWRVNDRIRLRRSESYWGREAVSLERIDALPIENPTTALNLYLTGEVEWLPSNYPHDLVDQLATRDDFYSGPGLIVYYYRINTEEAPFDDVRVREALNLAIDRRLIVEEVLGLGQIPAAHIVPPGMPGYRSPESAIRFDPERARVLLAEAGFPGGEGFPAFGILFNTHEMHKKIAEVIADQLHRNLGIEVRAYNQEWQSYLATIRTRKYTVARAGWIGDYEDPNTFLDLWVTEGGNNQTGWGDAVYDRLIAAASNVEQFLAEPGLDVGTLAAASEIELTMAVARREQEPTKRREQLARLRMQLLAEAERILVAEAFPIVPLYFYVVSGLVSPEVEGFHTELVFEDGSTGSNLRDLHPLRDLGMRAEGAR